MIFWMRWFRIVVGMILLAACSAILLPSSYTFTAGEMQAQLAKKFPVEKNYFQIVHLTLTHPQVSLQPDQKRIVLQFDADAVILGDQQRLRGRTLVSSGLAYNPADKTIVLKNPKLESQRIDGVSKNLAQLVEQMTAVTIHDRLDGVVVYTFTPNQLQLLGTHIEPENIDITAQGVVLRWTKK
ncbi:MAG: DUF1439 domain-containing protein [Betaproteobacteria bacterium]|nr:DUF1439 domain-containing protein [Betaproteobacteria bacterium]